MTIRCLLVVFQEEGHLIVDYSIQDCTLRDEKQDYYLKSHRYDQNELNYSLVCRMDSEEAMYLMKLRLMKSRNEAV